MSSFWTFFSDGGWGMYPTFIFGVVLLIAAVQFAWSPERKRLGFIFGMWATTLVQIVHATWTDFAAVAHALQADGEVKDDMVVRIFFEGFKESTRPGILGGLFLVLALLFVSIGLHRAASRVEA
jgi:hypothetical protein